MPQQCANTLGPDIRTELMPVRTIPLTRGYVAIVDDEDYDWLSQYEWRALGKRWVYATTSIPGVVGKSGGLKPALMHRMILELLAAPSNVYGEHKNGNTLDNQRENLRVCDNQGNQGNQRFRGGTSKYRGVYYYKARGKWMARIRKSRKLCYLGAYEDEEAAACAYDQAAQAHFGEFAKLNFPLE